MRADAHYLEELDSALFSTPVRQLDVRSLDAAARDAGQRLSSAFIESVRSHGVLQPLLVRSRGSRFQVLAGGRRLAAAVEAGLTEVPCLVERLDDEQARAIAAASNTPSLLPAEGPVRSPRARPDVQLGAFAECLSGVASSAGLLSTGSALTQAVAVDLVRAEAARALQLLGALRVLAGEVVPARRTVVPRNLLRTVVDQTEAERRLRGLVLHVERDGSACPPLSGDEGLLATAIGSLVVGPAALLDARDPRSVSLGATVRSHGSVVFVAEHDGAELPIFWRAILAEEDSPVSAVPGGAGALAALMLLRAARQIARLHRGSMSVDCEDGLTSLSIVLPATE